MQHRRYHTITRLCLTLLFISAVTKSFGQKADTGDKMTVYPSAKEFIHIQTDSGQINKFIDSAVFYQGTDTLYCDSLYQNITNNTIEAFSNVRVVQAGGTQATSNYLKYVSAQKMAYMRGDVSLTDGKNILICENMSYNLGTKFGVYDNSGTLKADSTTVTSYRGEYNVKSKEARFTGHVTVTDPHYYTESEDMGYNTESKLTRFFAKSVVKGDSGKTQIKTSGGSYDSHAGLAYFYTHSTIWYDGQYIEGDTLYFNRASGYGYAYGNVIAWDTSHQSTLYCGKAVYNQKKRVLLATIKPVLMQIKNTDTFFMRADTFYSAPEIKIKKDSSFKMAVALKQQMEAAMKVVAKADTHLVAKDAITAANSDKKKKKEKKKNNGISAPNLVLSDTTMADTTAPIYFTGYHHVRIYSDSMQAVCDSISYSQSDSMVRMMYSPVAWARNSQITGDTILMQLDSNRIRSIYVPNNTFIVSLAGPEKAQLYDQVQGKMLKGSFKNNAIENMVVYPDAEAIYYSKDDNNAFIGLVQAKSDKIHIVFSDQKIKKIRLQTDTHQVLTPLDKADLPNTKLSRFKWQQDRRPKNKEELFD